VIAEELAGGLVVLADDHRRQLFDLGEHAPLRPSAARTLPRASFSSIVVAAPHRKEARERGPDPAPGVPLARAELGRGANITSGMRLFALLALTAVLGVVTACGDDDVQSND
jgi:hypothetical protein